jgi:hypothetical protein
MNRFELIALAFMVMKGHFGNGDERRKMLGKNYEKVQRIVDVIIEQENK